MYYREYKAANQDSDEKMKGLTVRLPETIYRQFKVYVAKKGGTIQDELFDLITRHLSSENGERKEEQ